MTDPIVDAVRRVRDAHAARFHYDLDAIFRDIKEQERASGHTFVAGVSRQPGPPAAAGSAARDVEPSEAAAEGSPAEVRAALAVLPCDLTADFAAERDER